MLKIISLNKLKEGMYVERVVKQSGKVVVKSRGFIKSQAVLDMLAKKGILEVEVDIDKCKVLPEEDSVLDRCEENNHVVADPSDLISDDIFESPETAHELLSDSPKSSSTCSANSINDLVGNEVFVHAQIHPEELEKASKLYDQAKSIQKDFVKQLRSGDTPDFAAMHDLSQEIIDSLFDNSDALSCLMMLKGADDYLVEHALNCSILLAMFAKYKNLSQADTEDLTQAGLLMDIGMASLPADLLSKQDGFSAADWTLVRSHIDIGIELVERFADVPPIVLDIIQNHHERYDGSGYPKGKKHSEITEFAQMAAIVDSYDAMITNRGYKCSDNATEALQKLQTDPSMNVGLVTEFINAIGLHPVGSLVKLQSGILAVVTKRNLQSPLNPTVMSFYNIETQESTDIKSIILADSEDRIVSGIRPEEFSVNLPGFFKKAFSPVR